MWGVLLAILRGYKFIAFNKEFTLYLTESQNLVTFKIFVLHWKSLKGLDEKLIIQCNDII